MKAAKQTVKIFGQTVTVGTKLHAKLVQQKKQFDDLNKSEQWCVSGIVNYLNKLK